jgi:Citrate synthase, C-terminal domain
VPTFVTAATILHRRLRGFGHLNCRAYDPRYRAVREVPLEVSELVGPDPLRDVAMALEEHVLGDEYYVGCCVFSNINLYLSLVFRMMGYPTDYFCVLLCLPWTAGFLANWREGLRKSRAASHFRVRFTQVHRNAPMSILRVAGFGLVGPSTHPRWTSFPAFRMHVEVFRVDRRGRDAPLQKDRI